MHVKGFCTLGKHSQMLYVFLNCHFCAGQPPKSGQNVSLDVKAAFPWGFPKEWAVFSWDLKKSMRRLFIHPHQTITATRPGMF